MKLSELAQEWRGRRLTLLFRTMSHIYRALVPLFVRRSRPVTRLKAMVFDKPYWRSRLHTHDERYHPAYYEDWVEGPAVRSAEKISETIVDELAPVSVVDVGCGTGALLEALRQRGCRVMGLEYSAEALRYCGQRRLDVRKFDLLVDEPSDDWAFDVAISMEVAEHLPKRVADRYVGLLSGLADTIVFTAATPGQGGQDHLNEQTHEYWISKFEDRGLCYDQRSSMRWREHWRESNVVARWYWRNLMLFRRENERASRTFL